MTDNLILDLYKSDPEVADTYIKIGALPPLCVKRITDEARALYEYVPYFPHPFTTRLGSEGRSVSIQGHFGDQSYPFGHTCYDIMAKVHAGKYVRVASASSKYPEMTPGTLWLIDGISTERDAKTAGFLNVTLTLFGIVNSGGGWIW